MTNEAYLSQLLREQDLSQEQLDTLRSLREKIERQVGLLTGAPRFYYGGSFAKHTMIRDAFDLDIVVYWPSDCGFSLKGIFDAVGKELQKHWSSVVPKTVAWELPFQGGFHIDVVPGRALDSSFRYANLYRRDSDTSLQTSIKVHIDTVRNSDRREAIRLMKLWRARRNVPLKKSLALELLTIEGCKGIRTDQLEQQVLASLRYIRDNILTTRIVDPANSNNFISEEISAADKYLIQSAADQAIKAQYWSQVLT
jgi:hypothetical protein